MIKDLLQEVESKEDKEQVVEEMKNIYIRRETYESRLLKLGQPIRGNRVHKIIIQIKRLVTSGIMKMIYLETGQRKLEVPFRQDEVTRICDMKTLVVFTNQDQTIEDQVTLDLHVDVDGQEIIE